MQGKDRIIIQKIINYIKEVQGYVQGFSSKQFLEDKKL
jgi:uncharacterized protein with HEPN domain